jgi:membrane peptidoglycan carboxypeptidase
MVGVPTTRTYDTGERALDPVTILKIEDEAGNLIWSAEEERRQQQVVPAEHAYLINSILTDGQNTCVTFGCGGVTIPGHVAGVKTGTSEPYDPTGPNAGKIGETWAFGYTPDYVVGVWAGNSNNEPIVNIYSTSISYRVMRDTLVATYNGRPSTAFTRPPGIGERRACAGNRCTTELFVQNATQLDTAPVLVSGAPLPASTAVLAQGGPAETPTVVVAQVAPTATATPAPTQAQPTPQATPARSNDPASQPLAMLLPPVAISGASVNLEGWAWSQQMRSYRIEYSPVTGGAWSLIGQSSSPVRGGVLGVWQTSGLAPGAYNLRVVVEDAAGNYVSSPIQVVVGG